VKARQRVCNQTRHNRLIPKDLAYYFSPILHPVDVDVNFRVSPFSKGEYVNQYIGTVTPEL
jgi:hypothetical protein